MECLLCDNCAHKYSFAKITSLYMKKVGQEVKEFHMKFKVVIHLSLTRKIYGIEPTCILTFNPSFVTPQCWCESLPCYILLPPSCSIWFSGLSGSFQFCFPPFFLPSSLWRTDFWFWDPVPCAFLSLLLFALLSLAASCRFSCSFFLSQSNKDCLERAAALSFVQKILRTLCKLAIDLLS